MSTEPWLNGPIAGIPALLMPAVHALMQAQIDIEHFAANLSHEQIWREPNNAPSIGFHLRHIDGSCDRLLTYAKDTSLSEAQFAFLAREQSGNQPETARELITNANQRIAAVIDYIRNVQEQDYLSARLVGRAKLKTNVIGLLFHIAEHTQRHVGSIITLARVVRVIERV